MHQAASQSASTSSEELNIVMDGTIRPPTKKPHYRKTSLQQCRCQLTPPCSIVKFAIRWWGFSTSPTPWLCSCRAGHRCQCGVLVAMAELVWQVGSVNIHEGGMGVEGMCRFRGLDAFAFMVFMGSLLIFSSSLLWADVFAFGLVFVGQCVCAVFSQWTRTDRLGIISHCPSYFSCHPMPALNHSRSRQRQRSHPSLEGHSPRWMLGLAFLSGKRG